MGLHLCYQIQANCWLFLIAGYETTSTTLAYLAHVLCMFPQVQEKLAEEIQRSKLDDVAGELGQATIEKMEYLDQVIRETLRMYPPAPRIARRESSVDVNLKIPGKTVLVSWGFLVACM